MPNRNTKSSDPDIPRIRTDFDRAMNTPSPNPRYGGLTPVEVLRRTAKLTPKQESNREKPAS